MTSKFSNASIYPLTKRLTDLRPAIEAMIPQDSPPALHEAHKAFSHFLDSGTAQIIEKPGFPNPDYYERIRQVEAAVEAGDAQKLQAALVAVVALAKSPGQMGQPTTTAGPVSPRIKAVMAAHGKGTVTFPKDAEQRGIIPIPRSESPSMKRDMDEWH